MNVVFSIDEPNRALLYHYCMGLKHTSMYTLYPDLRNSVDPDLLAFENPVDHDPYCSD